MRRALWIAVVLVFVVGLVGTVVVSLWPRTPIEPTDTTFEDFDPSLEAIRIRGTAHYRGLIVQHTRGGMGMQPPVMYVYALFPLGDVQGREVRILVRTPEKPPPRVDFEFVEVEGWLDPPRSHTVPFNTEQQLARADYFFGSEVQVLEAWSIRSVELSTD